jgi:aryl carrier-like protein
MKGAWDSIHVFEVQERGRNAHYKLTSTVMLYMITNKPELGHFNLSGSLTRQVRAKTHKNILSIYYRLSFAHLYLFMNHRQNKIALLMTSLPTLSILDAWWRIWRSR